MASGRRLRRGKGISTSTFRPLSCTQYTGRRTRSPRRGTAGRQRSGLIDWPWRTRRPKATHRTPRSREEEEESSLAMRRSRPHRIHRTANKHPGGGRCFKYRPPLGSSHVLVVIVVHRQTSFSRRVSHAAHQAPPASISSNPSPSSSRRSTGWRERA